jgi:hypothetical protein
MARITGAALDHGISGLRHSFRGSPQFLAKSDRAPASVAPGRTQAKYPGNGRPHDRVNLEVNSENYSCKILTQTLMFR